jgi:hypothetical protein
VGCIRLTNEDVADLYGRWWDPRRSASAARSGAVTGTFWPPAFTPSRRSNSLFEGSAPHGGTVEPENDRAGIRYFGRPARFNGERRKD